MIKTINKLEILPIEHSPERFKMIINIESDTDLISVSELVRIINMSEDPFLNLNATYMPPFTRPRLVDHIASLEITSKISRNA